MNLLSLMDERGIISDERPMAIPEVLAVVEERLMLELSGTCLSSIVMYLIPLYPSMSCILLHMMQLKLTSLCLYSLICSRTLHRWGSWDTFCCSNRWSYHCYCTENCGISSYYPYEDEVGRCTDYQWLMGESIEVRDAKITHTGRSVEERQVLFNAQQMHDTS